MRLLGTPATFCQSCFGVVVLAEDGDVELVLGQAVILGDEVPGELDGLGFEVIAEGEIAEHLEEGVMAAGVADVFEVVVLAAGAHAFLRGGGAGVIALLEAEEHVLELVHAGVGEQQGGVVGGHQRGAADHAVAAFGKEVEKALSDFVTCHGDSFWDGLNSIVAKGAASSGVDDFSGWYSVIVTPDEMREIASLVGGLSSEIQELSSRMDAGFAKVDARLAEIDAKLDRQDARLERHGALLQTGSRWVNRMNQWAERIDRKFKALDERVQKLEGGEPRP